MSKDKIEMPSCDRCGEEMTWKSVQLVHARPVNIFYCVNCDQMAAQSVPNAKLVAAS
jgi:late competence protein required for DNA uptake (superfamily II DNA/RNA helicase)